MATYLYRCLVTGYNVQGFVADDPTTDDDFVLMNCLICKRVHLVNPKTGKVAGDEKS
jgi:hypothetical protein